MKFKENTLATYLQVAPVPLALERSLECNILKQRDFKRPILDVGCGEGIFAHCLFAEKIDVGIDPNARELAKAKEYGMYEKLIECFGNNIPCEDKSFQTIFSNSVMEHIPEIKPVLKECHRLLADDGKMFLTLPTSRFEQYTFLSLILNKCKLHQLAKAYNRFFNRFWAHYHTYDREDWTRLFSECGFKVRHSFEYGKKSVCLFNTFMTPFSTLAFVSKKLLNRWFPSSALRSAYAPTLSKLLQHKIAEPMVANQTGGLIFFELEKK